MKYFWLNKKENKDLIVFFNGWGMDEKPFLGLDCGNFDVIAFFDYQNLEKPSLNFKNYENKFLMCWSMGTYMCQDLLQGESFRKKIAINGTLKPIDNNFGIPNKIYDLTINNFNELTKTKFAKKMGLECAFSKTDSELKNELIAIKNFEPKKSLTFDIALIASNDKIISFKNQENFWKAQENTVVKKIEGEHFIFSKFLSWGEILNV